MKAPVPKELDDLLHNINVMQRNLPRLVDNKDAREFVVGTYQAHLDVLFYKSIDDYQRHADWLRDYNKGVKR